MRSAIVKPRNNERICTNCGASELGVLVNIDAAHEFALCRLCMDQLSAVFREARESMPRNEEQMLMEAGRGYPIYGEG